MSPTANGYTSHLQEAITVELAILLAHQLEIFRVVLQPEHNN